MTMRAQGFSERPITLQVSHRVIMAVDPRQLIVPKGDVYLGNALLTIITDSN